MGRKWLLGLLAFTIVTPALAQVVIQPIQRVPTIPIVRPLEVQAEANSDVANRVMTIEEAQARIAELTRERREANEKLKAALAKIDAITQPGGALVQAYCSGEMTSRNTAGAEQNCERYKCNQVSGLCNTSATSSAGCAPGFNWVAGDKCVTLAEAQQ